MAIKSEVVVADKVIDYPCLGCYQDGMIVLFVSKTEGTIVKPTACSNNAGYTSKTFRPDWTLYEGNLTLSNIEPQPWFKNS